MIAKILSPPHIGEYLIMGWKKYECVSVEDFETGKLYAFTINPCDEYQYWTRKERAEQFHKTFTHKMNNELFLNIIVDLKLESSNMGRLHYHGYIRVNTKKAKRQLFEYFLPRLKKWATFALCEYGPDQKSKEKWDAYVEKQDLYDERYKYPEEEPEDVDLMLLTFKR